MKKMVLSIAVLAVFMWSTGPAMAVSLDKFKLNGFFDLEYEIADDPGHPTSPVGDEKGAFDQYHFNVLMEFPVTDMFTVKGHIEYEHGPQIPGKGDIKIEWSYLEYIVNNYVRIRGGMLLTPFGIYNEMHDATPTYLSIRTPWSIYKTTSVGGHAMFPKFSTGILALGNYSTMGDMSLNYVVYAANGENNTKNEAEKDENANKAIGGRLMVSPIPGLSVGGSYYTGKKQSAPTTEVSHNAWAGSAEYMMDRVGLRAEYASSKLDSTTQAGWYGEASYSLDRLIPYLRYGWFDPDDDVDSNQWTELVYGVDFQVQPSVVLKLENRQFGGEAGNGKVSEDYNELGAAVTVAF